MVKFLLNMDVAEDVVAGISDWFMGKLYSILLFLDGIVYYLVSVFYQIFNKVAQVQLFSRSTDGGSSQFEMLTNRIYSILGIIMLFVLAYNILKLIINPDTLDDKSDSSMLGIIKNLIISLIIVALLPTGFNYLQRIQNRVLDTNVLSRIVFGASIDTNTSSTDNSSKEGTGGILDKLSKYVCSNPSNGSFDSKYAGYDLSITIFTAFFHPVIDGKTYTYNDCKSNTSDLLCASYVRAVDNSLVCGNMNMLRSTTFIDEIGNKMEYLPVISTAAGIVAAYLLLSFALDMGVRVAKLGILQLIAPVPVILRITKPKGGAFDKWLKELSKTYLMVFERLLVIYFALFTIQLLCSENGPIASVFSGSENGFIKLIAFVIVILGVLQFAKDAPKLIEELFSIKVPQMSIKRKLNENEYAMRGAAMVGTGGAKGIGNFVNSWRANQGLGKLKAVGAGLSGMVSGGYQGLKQSKGLNDIGKLKNTIVVGKGVADANEQRKLNEKQAMYEANKREQWEKDSEIKAQRESAANDYLKQHGDIYASGDWKNIHDEVFSRPDLSDEQKVTLFEQKVAEYNENLKKEATSYADNKVYQETYEKFKPAFGTTTSYTRKYKAQKNREKREQFFTGAGGKTIYDANIASMDSAIDSLKKMKEAVTKLGAETIEQQFTTASNDPNYSETVRSDLKSKREFERNKAAMKLFDEKLTAYGSSYLKSLKKSISDNPQAFYNSNLKIDELEKMVTKINENHSDYFDSNNNLTDRGKVALETEFKDLYKTINEMQVSINNDKIKKTTDWATDHRNDKKDS